jgi:hypothetical protein
MISPDVPATETLPVYLRVHTRPKKERGRWEPNDQPPNDNLWLVFDTETTTDYRQDLRFGVAQVYALGNMTRTILFYDKITDGEREIISRYAKERGFDVMGREDFVMTVFLPLALDQRAVVVGFNLPFDLSRLAVDYAPKKKIKSTEAWTLRLLPPNHTSFPYTPRVRIQHIDARKSFIGFTGRKGKRRAWRGAFIDLKTLTAALTGQGHSLKSAGEAFGCTLKKTEADYYGNLTEDYLSYCLNDVALTAELYQRALSRFREFNLPDHPSRVFSSASLGKAAFRARGVSPPLADLKLTGRIMAAFYAGKVECRVVGREVQDVAVLDFTSQYPSLYCLLGAERFLTAEILKVQKSTEKVRSWAESLTVDDLLRRETWENPLMWTLCEVEARDDILPVRSSYSSKADPPTIGWNRVTTEPGTTLPYLLPDVLAAKLIGGRLPHIVKATTFAPHDRQTLVPITILGTTVRPDDNLIRTLTEARIKEKKEKREGWEARALGLKILINAASYGVFVEVNVKRNSDNMEISGLDPGETFEEEARAEEPGALFSPLLGAMITSGAHLLLALLDTVAARHGAEVVYQDTDSAFVTPSRLAPQIAAAFDSLNPYSVPVPLLKDETPLHTGPVSFFGLSSKRYCLFDRDKNRCLHILKASDHGLGMYQVPGNREDFTKRIWERLIGTMLNGDGTMLNGDGNFSNFHYLPATAQFALTTPALLPRVATIEGIRPFTFLTIRYLNPAALPKGAETFELLPYHSPKDPAWMELAEKEDAKNWEHIIRAFSCHRDRKYITDPDGRIVRRHILVRRSSLVGLGKEGAKLAARARLRNTAGANPSVFVDWKRWLAKATPAEADRIGRPWSHIRVLQYRLRKGTLKEHGSAVRRLKQALLEARP